MKNYLSFGGGVNSVAMYLLLMDQGMEPGDPDKGFEAVFVDHGTDWPETYEYVEMFKSKYSLTVLKPDVGTIEGNSFDNLYDYCWENRWVPSFMRRWCTDKFKIRPIHKYIKSPAFMMIGFSNDESKRAKISVKKGIENRFPLIEAEIDRKCCKEIILKHGLSIPMKSGCFICPYQARRQWVDLRKTHPDLFCKAERLEKRNMDYRESVGKNPLFLSQSKKGTLSAMVNENQSKLWAEDEYPPCECML